MVLVGGARVMGTEGMMTTLPRGWTVATVTITTMAAIAAAVVTLKPARVGPCAAGAGPSMTAVGVGLVMVGRVAQG